MRYKPKYWIMILGLLIYRRCELGAVYTHMDNDDLAWFDSCKTEDTVYFRSNMEDIDTMVVIDCSYDNSLSPTKGRGWNTGGNYWAMGSIHFYIRHDADSLNTLLSFKKDSIQKPVILSSFFFNYSLPNRDGNPESGMSAHIGIPSLTTIEIDGVQYDDILVIDHSNSEKCVWSKECPLKRFVWSKSSGLVRYTFEDGTDYGRIPINHQSQPAKGGEDEKHK